jgi:predicted HTH transcriptional regulator
MDCLKEAFFNAIAHNDWSVVEPSVYMFDDRIEIISHGGLPKGETIEMFYQGINKPRNPSLMRILRDLGYVERTGHGVPNILSKYGKDAFQIYDSCINVVLPFDKDVLYSKTNDAKKSLEDIVIELIKKNPKTTKKQMVEITGKSKPTIERMLKNSDKIIRVGANNGGHWIIKE